MDSLGISKLDLKRQNRMQILRQLRNYGPVSRIDIAHTLHITKAAVTIITNEMIREGILCELGEQASENGKISRGRKKILLDIQPSWKLVVGIAIRSNWLDVGLSTLHGATVEHHSVPIDPDVSFEEIVTQISQIYRDIIYKNAVKPEMLLGTGVSIDLSHFETCGVRREKSGYVSELLVTRLEEIGCGPVVCVELTEGIAIAESDFPRTFPSLFNFAVLQMGGRFTGCVSIQQDICYGAHGRCCDFGSIFLGSGSTKAPARARLSRKAIGEQLRALRTQRLSPALNTQSMDNPPRAEWIFCRSGFSPEDAAVRQYFDRIKEDYISLLQMAVALYDPELLIIYPDGSVMEALSQAIAVINAQYGAEVVRLSRFDETNLYLTGAAAAVRQFFTTRGGMTEIKGEFPEESVK